jgi:hypothetical protein
MKHLIKTVKILFGIGLLIVAAGSVVYLCLSGSAPFKAMIVAGTPVICRIRGTEVKVPGRLVASLILGVPFTSLLAGAWLLRKAYNADHKHDP